VIQVTFLTVRLGFDWYSDSGVIHSCAGALILRTDIVTKVE
jgi:hypothetical protein